ncbi:hypothetical protein BU17DRAFT_43490, partial [Hysterangium stoloniferum]
KHLWLTTGKQWPVAQLGIILGCGLTAYKDDGNLIQVSCLFRIIVLEAAYII